MAGYRVVSVPRHLWKVWDRPEEHTMFMHARLAEAEEDKAAHGMGKG